MTNVARLEDRLRRDPQRLWRETWRLGEARESDCCAWARWPRRAAWPRPARPRTAIRFSCFSESPCLPPEPLRIPPQPVFETRHVCHAFIARLSSCKGNYLLPLSQPPPLTVMDAARTHFDVIVVGAGPAGIFAALELGRRDGAQVLLVERGPDISHRACPARKTGVCAGCEPCDITCGWGGAGAFSDGKLTLTTEVGGWLDNFVPKERLRELIDYVDGVWLEYGAPDEVHGGGSCRPSCRRQALLHGMTLVASPVRHMGTERSYDILTRMRAELEERIVVRTGVMVERILTEKRSGESDLRATGVLLEDGTRLTADAVIVAPGREGAGWLVDECKRLRIALRTNPVDIGVRVETSAAIMEPLTTTLYESKLIYYTPSFDDRVRTFCMNPYGEVSLEN